MSPFSPLSGSDIYSFKRQYNTHLGTRRVVNMGEDFSTIPVIDLALAGSPATKPQLLSDLRNALVRVGFLYVRNHSIPEHVQQDALHQSKEFFSLPLEKKLEIETVNSKHFLGYNRMNSQKTAAEIDHSESIAVCLI